MLNVVRGLLLDDVRTLLMLLKSRTLLLGRGMLFRMLLYNMLLRCRWLAVDLVLTCDRLMDMLRLLLLLDMLSRLLLNMLLSRLLLLLDMLNMALSLHMLRLLYMLLDWLLNVLLRLLLNMLCRLNMALLLLYMLLDRLLSQR